MTGAEWVMLVQLTTQAVVPMWFPTLADCKTQLDAEVARRGHLAALERIERPGQRQQNQIIAAGCYPKMLLELAAKQRGK